MRWLVGVAVLLGLAGPSRCDAADAWGGSLDVTNNYLVRGISRSDEGAAVQADVHYFNSNGFIAGLFVSNTRIDPDQPTDVELNAFVGYAWSQGSDWRGRVMAAHYAYPWNQLGSGYDYDELDVDATFQDWLRLGLVLSPNAPRYLRWRGLFAVTSESVEVNLQRPVLRRLSATAGVGYSYYGGYDAGGYVYWSVGASYDLKPVTLVLSYVNTTEGAKALFYNAAATGSFVGTLIWRF